MELTESLKSIQTANTGTSKAPWSPTGIAVLTLLFSPFAGGVLHGLNYSRLGQPVYRRFILARNLLAGGLIFLFANLPTLNTPGLGIAFSLFVAAYFYKTQEQAFQKHRSQGGRKASLLLPVVLSLVVLAALGVLYALLLFLS